MPTLSNAHIVSRTSLQRFPTPTFRIDFLAVSNVDLRVFSLGLQNHPYQEKRKKGWWRALVGRSRPTYAYRSVPSTYVGCVASLFHFFLNSIYFVCSVVGLSRAILYPVREHVACQELTEIHFCTNPSNRDFSASSRLRVLCGSCRCLSSLFLASPAASDHRAFSAFCRCVHATPTWHFGCSIVGEVEIVFRPAN